MLFLTGAPNAACAQEIRNVVIIGWDGAQRNHLHKMIAAGRLPNLDRLSREGSLIDITVTTARTETKPGWTEILTGYNAAVLGISDNIHYRPIPKSYTIFERLKQRFGPGNIKAVFISGKSNNVGYRGPHDICDNCVTRLDSRQKSYYWDRNSIKTDKTKDGGPPHWAKRAGEPYFYTKDSLDLLKTGLGRADNVGKAVLSALGSFGKERFIAFFHFEEPDEPGHRFGENSEQYSKGLESDDRWLGVIIGKLKSLGVYGQTLLVVASDHGFNTGKHGHPHAPYTFLASSQKSLLPSGDRKDVSPTIYDALGIDPAQFSPPLDGKSLLQRNRKP